MHARLLPVAFALALAFVAVPVTTEDAAAIPYPIHCWPTIDGGSYCEVYAAGCTFAFSTHPDGRVYVSEPYCP